MSNDVNQSLLERAAEMIEYWTGKLPAELIEQDIKNNDMDNLLYHVNAAENMVATIEYNAYDIY